MASEATMRAMPALRAISREIVAEIEENSRKPCVSLATPALFSMLPSFSRSCCSMTSSSDTGAGPTGGAEEAPRSSLVRTRNSLSPVRWTRVSECPRPAIAPFRSSRVTSR
jgi:hypothetical protein